MQSNNCDFDFLLRQNLVVGKMLTWLHARFNICNGKIALRCNERLRIHLVRERRVLASSPDGKNDCGLRAACGVEFLTGGDVPEVHTYRIMTPVSGVTKTGD